MLSMPGLVPFLFMLYIQPPTRGGERGEKGGEGRRTRDSEKEKKKEKEKEK